jgi:hypothetical protein
VHGNKLIATGGVGDDTKRSTDLIGELGHSIEFCVALDLNSGKDQVTNIKGGPRAASVDTVTVSLATVSNNKGDDLTGKIDGR